MNSMGIDIEIPIILWLPGIKMRGHHWEIDTSFLGPEAYSDLRNSFYGKGHRTVNSKLVS